MKNRELQWVLKESESCIVKEAKQKGFNVTNVFDELEIAVGEDDIIEIAYTTDKYCSFLIYEWRDDEGIFSFLDFKFTILPIKS